MNQKVIVSLTSWPPAIAFVPGAVRSILAGSVLPDKVVLYLTASQFPDGVLPAEIETLKIENPRFEVRFWEENIRSYTKLVPVLHDFPDDIIVTVDDDMRYPKRMLEMLLHLHRRYPDMIIAHNVRRIMTDAEGVLKGYFDWKRYKPVRYWRHLPKPGYRNLLFGLGGVLYPPHSLDEGMMHPEFFMSMAPTVDDVWFWAAATAQGTKVFPVPFGYFRPRHLGKPAEIALGTGNTRSGVDVNRNVMLEILKRYPVIKERLEQDTGPIKL
jgi:hypothetical protein